MLLKRSIISLTILKANTSTASSHRSLANQITEQDKESRSSESRSCDTKSIGNYNQNKQRDRMVPISYRLSDLPMSQHIRRHSMISGSSMSSHSRTSPEGTRRNTLSGGERRRFFKDLWSVDELLRPEKPTHMTISKSSEAQLTEINKDKQLCGSLSPLTQPHRSNSYMSAIVSQRIANELLPNSLSNEAMLQSDMTSSSHRIRPASAPGSRVTSAQQARNEILLQNGVTPSAIHMKNRSEIAIGGLGKNNNQFTRDGHILSRSVGRQVRRQRPNIPQFSSQGNKDYYSDKPYVTLPGPGLNRRSVDGLERKHPEMYAASLKSGSYMGRTHHKSTSSRASSTSSVSSGYAASHSIIKPLYEDWLNQNQKTNIRYDKFIIFYVVS